MLSGAALIAQCPFILDSASGVIQGKKGSQYCKTKRRTDAGLMTVLGSHIQVIECETLAVGEKEPLFVKSSDFRLNWLFTASFF